MSFFLDLIISAAQSQYLVSATLVILAALIISRVVYLLYISPLSDIPGPWYAAVSDAWITYHVVRLEQCKIVQQLFEQYGPVVRIGPNKVVFRDLATTRSVYNHHKFDKSTYYKSLLTNDGDHAMTTLEHAPHAMRRKAYAPHYTPTNLALYQPEIHEAVLEMVEKLNGVTESQPVECLRLFRHLAVDIVVNSSYGYRPGSIKKWASNVEDKLSTAISDFPKRGILRSIFPTWAWNTICRIPNRRWRQLCDSDKIMAEFVSSQVQSTRADIASGKAQVDCEKRPLLQRLLTHRYPSNEPMSDAHIISEAMGHMIAGADTTSVSLSYFFWELTRRADIMAKLRQELDVAMLDGNSIPDITTLNKLPYLNAFVKEGLRLYGAAPSLLERVVPESTTSGPLNEGFNLMGFVLPPGTIVATQAWSLHRDSSVFYSPETFLPERWMEIRGQGIDNTAHLTKMTQYMMPFGTGSRVCGGQNLAQVMLRVVVASIVRNFDIVAAAQTTEKTMEMKDSFVIFPASMECQLRFMPRKCNT